MDIVQIISIIFSVTIFVIVIELIRRNHLKERYSLVWLAASVILIVFSLTRKVLHFMAKAVGIYYPPAFLFLLAITFLLVFLLHLSTIISRLSDRNNRLAQEIVIVKTKLQALEEESERNDSTD